MKLLFKNIKALLQVRETNIPYVAGNDMKVLPQIENAYLSVEDGRIKGYGSMDNCPIGEFDQIIDVTGKMILPTWCDSHTHIVYAGNREGEFVDRINGLSYEEIANRGGGILNSATKLQETSEEELYEQATKRVASVMRMGTGALEIKSGYGLTLEAELKMLRVIKRIRENYPIPVKSTFLGAHAIPATYKKDKQGYLTLLADEIMPQIASEKLASFVDIFCEEGYFSVDDTHFILNAGKKYGLVPKIHVNQFNAIGGVQAGIEHNALSVDHLEVMRPEDIDALKGTNTMPVALPGCSYFLSIPYTPARKMLDAGLPLALATDYNPGSCPSGNMNFVVATACIKMNMTPEEAINAATINGAYAMDLSDEVGSITVGKSANFIVTSPIPSYAEIPYSFGENKIDVVYVNGLPIH
ncbi:imidazolonepropionase [Flavobacteriaceae bacterium F08102]|nr:imidazolonepropionase [Flavobacteriaceae bacterium F08102]